MAKDRITAIWLRENEVEWAAVATTGRNRLLGSGRSAFAPQADADAPEGTEDGDSQAGAVPTLREACAAAGGGDVVAAVSTDRLLMRVLTLPEVPDEDMRPMVALQVDKFSPFPADTLVISYERLTSEGEDRRVLVAAARREELERMGVTLGEAGMSPMRVDAVGLGWWRVLRDAGKVPREGREVLILLERGAAEMIVADHGVPVLFRALPAAARDTPEGAGELAGDVGHALLSLELEQGGGPVGSVHVWTAGGDAGALAETLREACQAEVFVDDLDGLARPVEGVARRALARETAAFDLTPPAWLKAAAAHRFRRRMMVVGAAAFGCWALAVGGFVGGLFFERDRTRRLEAEWQRWHEPATQVADMRRRVRMIRRYTDARATALECLREVSLLQPPGVDLVLFGYRKHEGVRLSGEALDVNLVYLFKNKLDASTLFASASLSGPRRDRRRDREVFDIDLVLSEGGDE